MRNTYLTLSFFFFFAIQKCNNLKLQYMQMIKFYLNIWAYEYMCELVLRN